MPLINLLPSKNKYRREILNGLSRIQKKLSPKFLYDKRGSELFEKICMLDEYYLTQAENEILEENSYEMSKWIGSKAVFIEPGCGSCEKTRHLLSKLKNPRAYVPMDISSEMLLERTNILNQEFTDIPMYPVVCDYTIKLSLPKEVKTMPGKRVCFFPGSTIGNLAPDEAVELLSLMGIVMGPNGGLLIGVDLRKSPRLLKRAYNDSQGVTAEFNLNVLDHLNREYSGSFDRKNFHHEAVYNDREGRMEMHLVCSVPHAVQIGDSLIQFQKNEFILTESSYKYSIPEFTQLAQAAGFRLLKNWQDHRNLFCVYYFERASEIL